MIQASIYETDDVLRLSMTGHADYAAHGQDIVCAAASILATALEDSLRLTGVPVTARTGPGKTVLRCPSATPARTLFLMAAVGLGQLAAGYPDHVCVHLDEQWTDRTQNEKGDAPYGT